jgi:glutathione peroxidase
LHLVATLGDIAFDRTDGTTDTLGGHAGEVVLVVNVASKCGLTPQYEALQALYARKKDDGFTVLGFPANDFAGQEPGTDDEISAFCTTQYDVQFPVLSKISVVGPEQHPLYAELTRAVPTADGKAEFRQNLVGYGMTPTEDPDVLWNFEKFLVARDGRVVARFAPTVTPDDPALVAAVDEELRR